MPGIQCYTLDPTQDQNCIVEAKEFFLLYFSHFLVKGKIQIGH
jgi:hypothetical protein